MPRGAQSSGQDLAPQVFHFGPRPTSANAPPKRLSSAEANRAVQRGENVAIAKKEFTVGNHHNVGPGANAKKLDEDMETLKVKTIPHAVSAMIQRARNAKNWTQADLAQQISERVGVVTEYENGKAVASEQVLVRMEKALGVHLRGAKAGQPMEVKKPAPKPAPKQ